MAFDNVYRMQELNRMRLEEINQQAEKARLIAAAREHGDTSRKPVLSRVGNVLIVVGEGLQTRYGTPDKDKSIGARPANQPA